MSENTATAKDMKLLNLLKSLPHSEHDGDDRFGLIACAVLSGKEKGLTDEFIRICESNSGKDFGEVIKLIFSDEHFPALEIIDEDE